MRAGTSAFAQSSTTIPQTLSDFKRFRRCLVKNLPENLSASVAIQDHEYPDRRGEDGGSDRESENRQTPLQGVSAPEGASPG